MYKFRIASSEIVDEDPPFWTSSALDEWSDSNSKPIPLIGFNIVAITIQTETYIQTLN